MSKWDKLLERLYQLSPSLRFEELKIILEHYGFQLRSGNSGSHCVFVKRGCFPIVVPKKNPVKMAYILEVKKLVEKMEAETHE